jgi:hypothetical protein
MEMRLRQLNCLLLVLLMAAALPSHAYIGPGAGAGTVAVVLGVLASIVLAFFAILYYPIKRMFRKRRTAKQPKDEEAPAAPGMPAGTDES